MIGRSSRSIPVMDSEELLNCRNCGPKPISEFNKHHYRGYQSECKSCRSVYNKQHYEKNKKSYIERAKKQQERTKEFIRELKNVPCKDCRLFHPYWRMHFDHLDGKQKLFNIANSFHSVSAERLSKEIEKCEVVCANCHADRTHKRLTEGR